MGVKTEQFQNRHAYLLLIHEISTSLEFLMKILDDEKNDFYIHIDKKAKNVSRTQIRAYVKKSKVCFVSPVKVYWGHSSMIKAEMKLLQSALKGQYDYYHVMSGADMPIKSKEEIFAFFLKNHGKEFVQLGTEQYQMDIAGRYSKYHFFVKQLGRTWESSFWRNMHGYSLAIQRRLHIDRKKKGIQYCGGPQWCSLTHEFASFCVQFYRKNRGMFRFTQIPDEWMIQTMLMNSPYVKNLYLGEKANDPHACMRWIDWERGNPYVFQAEDMDMLLNSEYLFARKFSDQVDDRVCKEIYIRLTS